MSRIVKTIGRLVCFLLIAFICFVQAGCRTTYSLPPLPPNAIKPVVAVTEFENQSGFSGQWQLGKGIPDLLVSELLQTDRVVVVDRQNISGVVSEIMRQGRDLFRKEASVERGRLKNARYLIRGVITDFTQTQSATGWFRTANAGAGSSGARAVVMIHLTLTDVETGEILASIPAEGTARASGSWVRFDYNNTSFGGDLFFKSPVGKATQEAVRKAVFVITKKIPHRTWEARIADAITDVVVINGGENMNIREGEFFGVREPARAITDPVTGDTIDWVPGKMVGRIRVTRVGRSSADGMIVSGEAKRGHYLEKETLPRMNRE